MLRKQSIAALVIGAICSVTWAQTESIEPDKPSGNDAARDAELAKQVTPLVDAFLNTAGVLTPDSKRLVFLSNRDGIDQLYVADAAKADSPATRLFTSSERVIGARVTRDGKAVVFRSDKGADENWSVYRVDLDGKNLTELTPGETLNRDDIFLPTRVPTIMYFSARKKEQGASSIYALPLAGGEAKKIYGIDGFGRLLDELLLSEKFYFFGFAGANPCVLYAEPDPIGYARFYSRSHDAVFAFATKRATLISGGPCPGTSLRHFRRTR
jgi:hypothetical protein